MSIMSNTFWTLKPTYDEIIYEYYDSAGNYHWFGKYSGEHFIPRVYTSANTITKYNYIQTLDCNFVSR